MRKGIKKKGNHQKFPFFFLSFNILQQNGIRMKILHCQTFHIIQLHILCHNRFHTGYAELSLDFCYTLKREVDVSRQNTTNILR